jgi:predicted PurR-regulated permease PerM
VSGGDREPQRVEVIIPVRTLLVLLAFGFLVALAILSIGTLLSIFLATVIALGLDPIVSALATRGWSRGVAAVAVFAALFAAVVVLVLLAAGPVWEQVVAFVNELPELWDQLTHTDGFQQLISTAGADDTIRDGLKHLAEGLPEAATTLLGIAGGAFGSVLGLVTLTFLALFLLMERPTITTWLFGFAPPAVEARWRPVVEESIQAVSSSLVGNVAISLVAGTVARLSSWLLGLPFPIVLAVIAGLLDLIPQVGATVASVILVAVALTVGTTEAIVMLVIQLVYQQVENYVVYPIVYRRAVELTPFTTIAAVLIAGSILGVVGAILAMPFAAVIKTVVRPPPLPHGRVARGPAIALVRASGDRPPRDAARCADAGQACGRDPTWPALRAEMGRLSLDRVPRRRRGGDRQPQRAPDDPLLPRGGGGRQA